MKKKATKAVENWGGGENERLALKHELAEARRHHEGALSWLRYVRADVANTTCDWLDGWGDPLSPTLTYREQLALLYYDVTHDRLTRLLERAADMGARA